MRVPCSLAYARCDDGATWRWRLPSYSEVVVVGASSESSGAAHGGAGAAAMHETTFGVDTPAPVSPAGATTALKFRPMLVLDFAPFDVEGAVTALGQLDDPPDGHGVDPDVVWAADLTRSEADRAWHTSVSRHSPPFCGSTVCVGFQDGTILVFRETSKSFSAHALTNPDAFRCVPAHHGVKGGGSRLSCGCWLRACV